MRRNPCVVSEDNTKRYNHAGGRATDIRTTGDNWNLAASLSSRIMVAGGGGGSSHGGFGGYAGGTTGGSGVRYFDVPGYDDYNPNSYNTNHNCCGKGGTQSAPGAAGYFNWNSEPPSAGSYQTQGLGGDGNSMYGGGGGGAGVESGSMGGGGGGSSFISGHSGCTTITGYVFTNTSMINGGASQTQPGGSSTKGHAGDGYARITFVSE